METGAYKNDSPDKALVKDSHYGRKSAGLLVIACVTFVIVLLCGPG